MPTYTSPAYVFLLVDDGGVVTDFVYNGVNFYSYNNNQLATFDLDWFTIGAQRYPTVLDSFTPMNLAEVVVFDRALTDEEQGLVYEYAAARYGLAPLPVDGGAN